MANHLKAITTRAKQLYKTGKYAKWTDAIKAASKQLRPGTATKKRKVKHVAGVNRSKRKPAAKKRSSIAIAKHRPAVGSSEKMIGALRAGSKFISYKGHVIERKRIHYSVPGRKTKKSMIRYFTLGIGFHSLKEAKAHINYHIKQKK